MSILVEALLRVVLGSGVLIQRVTLATPTQKRFATCSMVRFSFARTDNTLRRNDTVKPVKNDLECKGYEEHINGLALLFTRCFGVRLFMFNEKRRILSESFLTVFVISDRSSVNYNQFICDCYMCAREADLRPARSRMESADVLFDSSTQSPK